MNDSFDIFINSIFHNIGEPVAMLLMQIIAILFVSRIVGWFFIKIGQPTVIGEILAGIILGPSLLGYFYPEAFNFLFAPESLDNLYILSQIGLVLFMFVIGMELNLSLLRNKMGTTYVISNVSIIFPYLLGVLLAYYIYDEFAASQTTFLPFALFIGISMSITAFPVLARIVQEKGMTKTHIGQMSIISAAFNDVTAWCILAAVIAISKTGSIVSSLYTIGLSILYILFMLYVVRPFLKKIGKIYSNTEVINKGIIAFLFLFLTLSSFTTQLIGIHALFGAFLAGVVMPEIPEFRKIVIDKIEDVALTLLLPLFFVYTGLRTEIGLLNTPYLWMVTSVFILVAIVGKFIGAGFSAKIMGENWRDSLSVGILMNTRGLMEIVVLNIGYEMGILSKPVFAMLVIMALVTTFMTTPLLSLVQKVFPTKDLEAEYRKQQAQGIFKVLIAVGNPENGKTLLNVAKHVLDGIKNTLSVTALHITPDATTNPLLGEDFAEEGFAKINSEAKKLNIPVHNDYKITDNIELGVVKTINNDNYDFLLVGGGVSTSDTKAGKLKSRFRKIRWINKLMIRINESQEIFYPGSLIKDKTRFFVENSQCSVGIFINRNFMEISNVVVMLNELNDDFLIRYAHRLLKNDAKTLITFIDEKHLISKEDIFKNQYATLTENFPNSIKLVTNNNNNLQKYDFMMISYQCWNNHIESGSGKLDHIPSTIIINKKESRFSKKGKA
ncbi:MAG: cation/H(+) antiporter [Bacteroidales bacterium 36-12]|nr:MAG: cation/H(+) antiporter [Bacteroidales bacterium 36-12]